MAQMVLDLKKEAGYKAGKQARLLQLAPARYLAVDGVGDPNTSPAYTQALSLLYPAAYKLKFASKAAGANYVVPPLEGLWHASDMDAFLRREKSAWQWTMLLRIPQIATEPQQLDPRITVRTLEEGLAFQVLHTGPYDAEGPVIAALHEHIVSQGYALAGEHHEIYLSDPRRSAPEKLRTILRQPVEKK